MTDEQAKLWDMIEDNHTCMLVTHGPGGTLHARPMHAIAERDANEILFFTAVDAGKTHELENAHEVCLCFASPKNNDFVAVQGRGELSQDRALIDKHWNTMVKAWFPDGKDSPNVGLIRVKVRGGEYWDGTSSDIVAMLKMMTAARQDRRPDMGENRKVGLS